MVAPYSYFTLCLEPSVSCCQQQDPEEHAKTEKIVQKFLENEGPKWQKKLQEYDQTVDSYIEEFWCKLLKLVYSHRLNE